MKLRIGHLSTLYHTSILIMAHEELRGALKAELQWRLYGTGPAIVEGFMKEEINMAYIGLPPAIVGIAKGIRIKCIAGGHIEGTVIASSADKKGFPEVNSLKEILVQFRRVGVPGRGSIHDLILKDMVSRFNSSAEVVNLPWADEVLEAFVRREVDAVCGTPALAEAVVEFADGKVLCPPELLWPHNPSYGILVKEELIQQCRELLREFLVVHERASEMLRTRKTEVSRLIAEYIGVVDEDFVYNTLNISPKYCASLTEEYIACSMRMAKRLRSLGYIQREVSVDEVFNRSLIEEVHPESPHYNMVG
jgi:NitT/TauT family transport system substrate-binding protein